MKESLEEFMGGGWMDSVIPMATNLAIAIAIYIIGKWVARRIVNLVGAIMEKKGLDLALRNFISSILSTVLGFVVVLAALEQLGVNTTSLLALLGAAGLAVGLALKDSLSNFAAGVMLILFKPFKIGDFVDAGGVAGVVEQISVFSTQFRTGDNKEIIVPNSHIYGGVITNVSAKPTRRIDMVIGIGYDDDMKKARDLIMQVLNSDERVLKDPAPVVAVSELGDNSVNFVVRPWVEAADYWAVQWEFLETIKETFDANGVSFPYPQQDVHMHNVA
jgi:small conductance mechanosensitive channel